MAADVLQLSLSVVGPGRAAIALARSWLRAGAVVAEVLGRDPARTALAARRIGGGRPRVFDSGRIECGLLIVGVPDDAIAGTARSLSGRVSSRAAFHLSGALAATELSPLSNSGAAVGSMHPVRAFSGSQDEDWKGAFVAVEGDAAAVELGQRVAAAVGARPHTIAAAAKPLYHAAATLAAGGSLALVSMALRAWAAAGLSQNDALPALADLAGRAAQAGERGFSAAFTGPVARRDVGTVRAHVGALAPFPEMLAVYRALARETLSRTAGLGKEEEIVAVLENS